MMVLARAHVLITLFSFLPFIAETFVINASWTNGPFLILLAIFDSQNSELLRSLAALPSADDKALRGLLLVARLHAFLVAPLVHDVASTAGTTTVRVIDRVHDLTANLWTLAKPTALPRLAMRHQLVLGVADSADSRETLAVNQTHLGGRHAERYVLAFLGADLESRSPGASHLAATSGLELDVVHVGTERNLHQRQRIADSAIRA